MASNLLPERFHSEFTCAEVGKSQGLHFTLTSSMLLCEAWFLARCNSCIISQRCARLVKGWQGIKTYLHREVREACARQVERTFTPHNISSAMLLLKGTHSHHGQKTRVRLVETVDDNYGHRMTITDTARKRLNTSSLMASSPCKRSTARLKFSCSTCVVPKETL